MTNTPTRLCGRVDGATVCAEKCWRAAALGDAECVTPHHPSCPARRCGCPTNEPHPNVRCARKCICPRGERGAIGSNLLVIVNVLCALAIGAFAFGLLVGWFGVKP